jgi:D-lactate dehydrogenase
MYDVYFYEAFEEEVTSLKNVMDRRIKTGYDWMTIQEKGHEKPPARIISLRTQSIIPEKWSKDLSGILTRSTGYNHLRQYLKNINHPLPGGYLPLYCNRAVAEQALLLWMALIRKLNQQINKFNRFDRDGLTGRETLNKTLVVVGVGNIGSEVCKIGQGLGMKVLGVDLIEKFDFVEYTSIEQALPQADIIVCAMNLNKLNVGYFNYKRLKTAPAGVVFINIARGEMSPSQDLLRLMSEHHLGGLGMDVYNKEAQLAVALRINKVDKDEEIKATIQLAKMPNVIFTPHNAFNTKEALNRKSQQTAQQIDAFIQSGKFLWPVPPPEKNDLKI